LKADESQQNQAIATGNSGYGFFRSNAQLVSDGHNWATKWHCGDIFEPSSENYIGTRECYSYRKKIFDRHPYLVNALKTNYLKIYNEKSLREANLFIGGIDKELIIHDLNLSDSTDKIKTFCDDISSKCRFTVIEYGENKISYQICRGIANRYKIVIKAFDNDQPFIPTLNKLSCPKWWFKKINLLRLQYIEQVSRKRNLVHKNGSCYASQFAIENGKTQLKRSFEYLLSNSIVNEDSQTYSLFLWMDLRNLHLS